MLNKLLGRTEGHQAQGASWRDALPNAEKTEPPPGLLASVVKKFPLDVAAKSAKRANDRLTAAEGELMRAEIALEQVRKENTEREEEHLVYVAKQSRLVDAAKEELGKAQAHMTQELIDYGAFERIGNLIEFLSAMKARAKTEVVTVRIDNA